MTPTELQMKLTPEEKEQFLLGYKDCRDRLGEDTRNTSKVYHEGFTAGCMAYNKAIDESAKWRRENAFSKEENPFKWPETGDFLFEE